MCGQTQEDAASKAAGLPATLLNEVIDLFVIVERRHIDREVIMIFTIVFVIIVAPALALLCYAPPGQRLQLKLKESATSKHCC